MKIMWLLILSLISAEPCFSKTNSSVRKEIERFESVTLPNTQVIKIYSKFTKQNYKIDVSIPASYSASPQQSYPSFFMLDADYSFNLAKQTTEHLSDRNHIPETFIFGIAYDGTLNYRLNRTRDYTPIHVADGGYGPEFQKYSGGGPAFADFLEKELIPFLQQRFRISQQRILVGHSYGGLFASWLLVTRPQVFDGLIAISPSLWYGDHYVFKAEQQSTSKKQDLKMKVKINAFFAIGAKETKSYGTEFPMVEDLLAFVNTLQKRNHKNLKIASVVFPDESHDTVFPAALTRGIMSLLAK
jgi:predicted alpha/beta superfamily hydrolase